MNKLEKRIIENIIIRRTLRKYMDSETQSTEYTELFIYKRGEMKKHIKNIIGWLLFPGLRGLFIVMLIASAGLVSLGFLYVASDLEEYKAQEAREATMCFYSGEPLRDDCIRDESQGIAYNRREEE